MINCLISSMEVSARRPESVAGITWRSSSTVIERKTTALALNTTFTVDEIIAAINNINMRASPRVLFIFSSFPLRSLLGA